MADIYSNTYVDAYDSPVAVGVTRATTWRVSTSTATSRSTSWNVASQGKVGATRQTSWVARATTTLSRATLWNVAGGTSTVATTRLTRWAVAVISAPPAPGTVVAGSGMRLRMYLPNGADQGPLPAPQSATVAYPLNDVGALTFSYSVVAPRASLLGQPCEIAVQVTPDGGTTWTEPDNSRFLYITDGNDPLEPTSKFSVEAKGYVWALSKAVVLPNNLLNADGKRAFLSSNVGTILKTLFQEAQARGAMSGITYSSFSTTLDSAGVGWNQILTIYYTPGLNYLQLLRDLADQGFCDFKMNGRSLFVYNADSTMAADRTVGSNQVIFRAGRDLTDAPFTRTWEGIANYAYFAGDATAKYEYTNPLAITPWGRWETFLSNGSVSDAGTMAVLTQALLSQSQEGRTQYTCSLDFTRTLSSPFTSYNVGDYVWRSVDGQAPERLRIRQLTLQLNDKGVMAGNVVLNDRFLEADVRAARRINGITNGASGASPGTGGNVPPSGGSAVAPAKVLGVVVSSSSYMGPGGFPQAQVSVSWQAVTTNVDGTAADNIDHYEILQRQNGLALSLARQVGSATDTAWDNSPYVPGTSYRFNVRAVNTAGLRGPLSDDFLVTMAADVTPPQAPSGPIVTAKLGMVRCYWDGNPATGTWPTDFSHIEVHYSTVNNFTPIAATQIDHLYGQGATIVTDQTYGVPLFFKFVAVDTSGLKSTPSVQGTGTPTQLVNTDLITAAVDARLLGPGAVATAAIADLAVGTAQMKDLSVVTAKIGDLSVNSAKVSDLDVGKLTAGVMNADVTIANRFMTATAGNRVEISPTGIRVFYGSTIKIHLDPATAQLRILSLGDVTHTSTGHGLQIGTDNGPNMVVDRNEILARNNGTYGGLYLNKEGGTINIGGRVGGYAADGSNLGQVPMDENHRINLDGAVYIRSQTDGGYADEYPPFLIGLRSQQHLWFDNNEMGSAVGDAVTPFNIMPSHEITGPHNVPTYMASTTLVIQRISLGSGTWIRGHNDSLGSGLQFMIDKLKVTTETANVYGPILASAFTPSSSKSAKRSVRDVDDPLSLVLAAPSRRWKYRPEVADPEPWHVGPMADDLPLIASPIDDGLLGLDLGSQIGLLWAAFHQFVAETRGRKPEVKP